MAKKKFMMSVTATAAVASAFVVADEVEAASYNVQSGDSLWKIAQAFDTSVANLKRINNLSGDLIFPNQVILTREGDEVDAEVPVESDEAGAGEVATYTVKRGDSLSVIAARHNISLGNLMKWNELETTLIFPGDVFVVSEGGKGSGGAGSSGSGSGGSEAEVDREESPVESTTYIVKSGDTLSAIASRYKVTVRHLKEWNHLRSDLILVGQRLTLKNVDVGSGDGGSGGSASEKPTADVSYQVDQLIRNAESMLGVPYLWGGQTSRGFDCSGFVHFAYNQAGMSMGRRSTQGYYDRSYYVDQPQIGDLVFFEGTYRAGISHMGIYIGNNEFIHAGTSTGVTVANINNSYWAKHYVGMKRFY